MKRNQASQQSLNEFMGGYSNFGGLSSIFSGIPRPGSLANPLGLPTPSNPFPGLPTPPGIPTTGIPALGVGAMAGNTISWENFWRNKFPSAPKPGSSMNSWKNFWKTQFPNAPKSGSSMSSWKNFWSQTLPNAPQPTASTGTWSSFWSSSLGQGGSTSPSTSWMGGLGIGQASSSSPSVASAVAGNIVAATIFGRMKHLKGNGKNVRLFEHCYTDKSFVGGWFDIVTPQKSKTVRLRLGRKGQTTNDTLSAVYVPKGYDVVLHEYPRSSPKFGKGKHKILRTTSKCLADIGWNDIVSEIDIVPQARGFGGISQYVQSWGTRVDANPIQTVGNYGGVTVVKPGTGRPLAPGDGGRVVTVTPNRPVIPGRPGTGRPLAPGDGGRVVTSTPNRPVIPGKPAVFPQAPTEEPTRGTTNQSSGTSWTPPPAPSSPSPSDSSAPSFDQWMQDNARPVAPVVTTPMPPVAQKQSEEEEESMWKNPLVWGGIAVVVIGLIYVLSPDKKAAKVVKATPTPAPVKAKARKGMKVKRSGRRMKRSGRIKK